MPWRNFPGRKNSNPGRPSGKYGRVFTFWPATSPPPWPSTPSPAAHNPSPALSVGLSRNAGTGYRLARSRLRAGPRAGTFMAYPAPRFLLPILITTAAGFLYAQVPFQTREPPLADEIGVEQAKGRFDPDDPIKRVEHVTPAPRTLPSELIGSPDVVPAQYAQVIAPPGELPTPVVTLNIEGNNVAPSGQPVAYKVVVRNVSRAKAHNVAVRLIPPKTADKVKADPPPTADEAETRWEFKSLAAGETRTIDLVYKPKADTDEIKVQARVQFDFGRGMITSVSPPTITLKKEGPEKLVVGDVATYRITVTNTGKVMVRDIEVRDLLLKGLVHDEREMARGSVDGRLMSSIDRQGLERMWSIPSLPP